jgi:hypothetical protein
MTAWTKRVLIAAAAVAAAGIAPPAMAQTAKDGGIPSETQARLHSAAPEWDWGWLGLLGIFGLAGLRHDPDYHHAI